MESVTPFWLKLQGRPGRHAWLSLLLQWLLQASSSVLGSCWRVDGLIEPKQLALFNVGYIIDKVLPQFQAEKCGVFLMILAVARMVIWMMWKKGFMMVQTFLIVIWFFYLDISFRSKLDAIENA